MHNLKRYAAQADIDHAYLHRTRHTFARIVAEDTGSSIQTQDALEHGKMYMLSDPCAWLMIAIQIWVSVRWQTFTVALGVGISGTVMGYVLINSEK